MDTERLILDHMGLATNIAAAQAKRVPPWVDRGDLFAAAYLGLVESANSYDPELGEGAWVNYAKLRITGAVIDEMRRNDWLTQHDRVLVKQYQAGMVLTDAQTERARHREAGPLSLDELRDLTAYDPPDRSEPVDADLIADETQRELFALISTLPARQFDAVMSYHVRGESQWTISRRWGVTSKSRVSQVLAQAYRQLRAQTPAHTA